MDLSKLNFFLLFLILITCGCSKDKLTNLSTLQAVLDEETVVIDNVIACAASADKAHTVNVFFYPREGATNFRYFETESINVDKNNFESYTEKTPEILDVFNGKIKRFLVNPIQEKWVIVSFVEDGKMHICNPIYLKHISKPTEKINTLTIDNSTSTMPIFSWKDGMYTDSAIYFQVVTDNENNFLSGTYTYDKMFRYYKLDNVVLNITTKQPPTLNKSLTYGFTLMAVSQDNWVNLLTETSFSP
ncbi:hypothetical protein [Cellulophaga lytica]|uniref:Lipoprotein n=1 Tax=Cellulophaga lytica (strain ATCC 23178 / DSM 7489 / JCM 8516 / NBRC 14961 / NCIMB 1423 / VKM B-1433 / Cy l20) TaxID=867900 RepID=F0RCG6_CELLC|nr:hypothetical protein [Cellulophaga lytica]ADY28643.1 hypothetical protein Celly_0811 [Cellulophaga lytica DSM 7489]WQG77178.1 hypothetical protein SR888_15965 [Cellulophaga lytica]